MNILPVILLLAIGQASIERIEWQGDKISVHYQAKNQEVELRELGIEAEFEKSAGTIVQDISQREKGLFVLPSLSRETNGFFLTNKNGIKLTGLKFPTQWLAKTDPETGLVQNLGIKGLQVQMMDDALILGVHHAAFNLNLASLLRIPPDPKDKTFEADGIKVGIRQEVIDSLPIKLCQERGIRAYVIVLAYRSGNAAIDKLLLHPSMSENAPNNLGAFNTATIGGVQAFKTIMDHLCINYSKPVEGRGTVAGWIIGNEVNAHYQWYNRGPSSESEVVSDYHKALRIAHGSLKRSGGPGRIYTSLEHHWAMRPGTNVKRSMPGKLFLKELVEKSEAGGNFDWHLAYHPYPENLFEPRSWLDKSALANLDSPKITFRNLEQIVAWSKQQENLSAGKPRRIILSEQGFHGPPGVVGESNQAAGYVYGYKKASRNEGIDAFILHRQVDHAKEGGLLLGLWSHKPDSVSTPLAKKLIWQVFRDAGTAEELKTFEKYKTIIGPTTWEEIYPSSKGS